MKYVVVLVMDGGNGKLVGVDGLVEGCCIKFFGMCNCVGGI